MEIESCRQKLVELESTSLHVDFKIFDRLKCMMQMVKITKIPIIKVASCLLNGLECRNNVLRIYK